MYRNIAEKVADHRLFRNIGKEHIQELFSCMGVLERQYKRGEMIILEEDEVKYIGIILEGEVSILKEDEDGEVFFILKIPENEVFGESFACGSICGAKVSFAAHSDCRVLFLPYYRIIKTCKMTCSFHHKMIENIMVYLSDRNVSLMERIEILSQKNMRRKIIRLLEYEVKRQNSDIVYLDMGRKELAEYISADRSALSREISKMEKEGILEISGKRYRLKKEI